MIAPLAPSSMVPTEELTEGMVITNSKWSATITAVYPANVRDDDGYLFIEFTIVEDSGTVLGVGYQGDMTMKGGQHRVITDPAPYLLALYQTYKATSRIAWDGIHAAHDNGADWDALLPARHAANSVRRNADLVATWLCLALTCRTVENADGRPFKVVGAGPGNELLVEDVSPVALRQPTVTIEADADLVAAVR